MSTFFYDGQVRRYLTQMIRVLSNFKYADSSGKETEVPVLYGDLTRQVGAILRQNSENKIPCAPRWAIYITAMEQDRNRTKDFSFVDKVNVRERAYDEAGNEYLNTQGKNYTVERLMPTPFTLTLNADLWTTNTDQKLQLIEQILLMFNPTVEIQTTDNFVDWTSLTTVTLSGMTFSSRAIPVGVDSEIDVATLTFTVPIWLNPPVKVKRLGVITNIINSVLNERTGTIDMDLGLSSISDADLIGSTDDNERRIAESGPSGPEIIATNWKDYGLQVTGTTIQLTKNNLVSGANWRDITEPYPGTYQDGISRITLIRTFENDLEITGTFTVNSLDETEIIVSWDADTYPDDSVISGPARDLNAFTSVDYIIDPTRTNPTDLKIAGARFLILEDIGSVDNTDGPDAWKNTNGSDLIASANDIIEWTGSAWAIVFNASETTDITYTTNLNTGTQYRWDGSDWLRSIDGLYPVGTWRISLDG
jgi:hypothetical protein